LERLSFAEEWMPGLAIGVDVGGSQVKMVAIDADGIIHQREALPLPRRDDTPEAILDGIIAGVQQFRGRLLTQNVPIQGMSFAFPCYLEGPDWSLGNVTNLAAMEGYPVRPALAAAFGEGISGCYDTNAAGLAEFLWGAGRGFQRVLFMGIGTGISASFFTQKAGHIAYTQNTLGESGHIIVDPEGDTLCACGGTGCLEAVAASPAICRRAEEAARCGASAYLKNLLDSRGHITSWDVTAAAETGDTAARAILEQTGRYIGIALTTYLHLFAPSRVILGGGVSLAGELLLEPVRRTIQQMAGAYYLDRFDTIVPSKYGLDAGAVGSACLVFHPELAGPDPFPTPIAKTKKE
jgi:glucokinase